jgi:hypothetical protein
MEGSSTFMASTEANERRRIVDASENGRGNRFSMEAVALGLAPQWQI